MTELIVGEYSMQIKIRRELSSRAKIYENVIDSYQKGDLYCIYLEDGKVIKIPIKKIFDIEEEY